MKKLLCFSLIMISLVCVAQPLALPDVGVPEELSVFQNTCFTQCESTGVMFSTEVVPAFDYNANGCRVALFTPTFDLSRQYATLDSQFVEIADGGKEFITHCYFNLASYGAAYPEGDDPCGRSQRLPRKKVS